eukprot:g74917.t1
MLLSGIVLLTAQFKTRATVPAGTVLLSVLSLSGLGSSRILQILLLPPHNFENSNRFPIILDDPKNLSNPALEKFCRDFPAVVSLNLKLRESVLIKPIAYVTLGAGNDIFLPSYNHIEE